MQLKTSRSGQSVIQQNVLQTYSLSMSPHYGVLLLDEPLSGSIIITVSQAFLSNHERRGERNTINICRRSKWSNNDITVDRGCMGRPVGGRGIKQELELGLCTADCQTLLR